MIFRIILFFFSILFSFVVQAQPGRGSKFSESSIPMKISTKTSIVDDYRNPDGCFSSDLATAEKCAPGEWNVASAEVRAKYVSMKLEELLKFHKISYSSRILTCMLNYDSGLNPQILDEAKGTAGISQVSKAAIAEYLDQDKSFYSAVEGFETIRDGDTYFEEMKASMVAQMEIGLVILNQKNKNLKKPPLKKLLAAYHDGKTKKEDKKYIDSVFACAICIKNSKKISNRCLQKARK